MAHMLLQLPRRQTQHLSLDDAHSILQIKDQPVIRTALSLSSSSTRKRPHSATVVTTARPSSASHARQHQDKKMKIMPATITTTTATTTTESEPKIVRRVLFDEKSKEKEKDETKTVIMTILERFIHEECDFYQPGGDRAMESFRTENTDELLTALRSMPYFPSDLPTHKATIWSFTKAMKRIWTRAGMTMEQIAVSRPRNAPGTYLGVCLKDKHRHHHKHEKRKEELIPPPLLCDETKESTTLAPVTQMAPVESAIDETETVTEAARLTPILCLSEASNESTQWYTLRICLPFVGEKQWRNLIRLDECKRRVHISGSFVPCFESSLGGTTSQPLYSNMPGQLIATTGDFELPINVDLNHRRSIVSMHECRLEFGCKGKIPPFAVATVAPKQQQSPPVITIS